MDDGWIDLLDAAWDGSRATITSGGLIGYFKIAPLEIILDGCFTADDLRKLANWMDEKAGIIPKTCATCAHKSDVYEEECMSCEKFYGSHYEEKMNERQNRKYRFDRGLGHQHRPGHYPGPPGSPR